MPLKHKIPTSYARFLTKTYHDVKRSNQWIPDMETRSVWYSKETYLQALGLPIDTPTGIINGIRIYLGSYTEEHPNPDKKGKITLVLVPTKGGTTVDDHKDILDDPRANPQDLPDPVKEEYNDGQLCPPNCHGNGGLLDPGYQ
jgi:hypothetical protein